jgi:ribose 1,5-bisphosphokinase
VTGRLIAVVGASGVGKDRLIDALAASIPSLLRVRRTITRPPGAGERFDSVSAEAFAEMEAEGAFCLSWEAHGLRYGIPVGVRRHLRQGRDAVANLSRAALPEAAHVAPRLLALHLVASPETLARRLGARGREDAGEIAGRLGRAEAGLPEGALARGDDPERRALRGDPGGRGGRALPGKGRSDAGAGSGRPRPRPHARGRRGGRAGGAAARFP